VPITNDNLYEGGETYTVNLSNATGGASIGTASVSTEIVDDGRPSDPTDPSSPPVNDDRPQVTSVTSPSVTEGDELEFVVTLSNPSTTPTTVTLTPASGSADLGVDTATPIEVSFDGGSSWQTVSGPTVDVPAGVTSFTVRVPTVDDSISEGDETITLSAGTPQNAAPVVGTGTIVDNEGAPTINISGPAIVDEAAGTATYTVTLSHASAGPVTVDYASADGSATAGSDYDATSGTLSFAPGTTSLTITVPITNDNLYEGGETYTVNLSNATGGASIGTASVSTEIVDGRPAERPDRPRAARRSTTTVRR
jgi:hypothetical protein